MGAVIAIVVFATLFLVISVFLFRGRGSWMIAGYNTASDEEKAQYDEKKLCKGVGGVTLTVSVLLYIMAFLAYRVEAGLMDEQKMLPFAIVFVVAVFLAITLNFIYINKKCKIKQDEGDGRGNSDG